MRRALDVLVLAAGIALLVVEFPARVAARQIPPFGGEAAFRSDLAARRARVLGSFTADTVVVLSSAPPRVFSTDTNYEYRQESNLLYLTGLSEPNVTLVLVPGAEGPKEFLFVPAADATRELWDGPVVRPAEAERLTGITNVFAQRRAEAFDAFMRAFLGEAGGSAADAATPAARGEAASRGRRVTKVAVIDGNRGRTGGSAEGVTDAVARTADARRWIEAAGRTDVNVVDAAPALENLRRIKTPYEQRVLRRSVEISAEAHIEGMKATRPGRWEYEVEAAIEHWFLRSGAMSWGYPSIVASGPNATVLHYIKSTRQMQAGDLLLVDAAANFQGLTGDITRTYPVSRQFTSDQRALYEVVSNALDAGLAAARPGGDVAEIERAVKVAVGKGLLGLGLVVDPRSASGEGFEIGVWLPHLAVHWIGVDVHDHVGTLEPGAAFVIEPGVYIRPDALTRLAGNPNYAAFVAAVRPSVARFANMGIRLEDSILMTASGPENLSRLVPRAIRDVEAVVGTGK
jgi:Xaa-Pro aminopeptidase